MLAGTDSGISSPLRLRSGEGDVETVCAALLLFPVVIIGIAVGCGGGEDVASPLDEDTGICRIVTVAFASCAMFVWHLCVWLKSYFLVHA